MIIVTQRDVAPPGPTSTGDVESVHRAFYDAWERGLPEAALSCWADDDDISLTLPGGAPCRGREAVRHQVVEGIRLTAGIQFFFEEITVAVRGDFARLTCVESVLVPEQLAGADLVELPTTRLAVNSSYLRLDGVWRIWSHASGPVLTGVERG